jgi:hypothetical protein
VIVGVAFLDIGKKLPAQQLSFFFMMLQMGALSNMVGRCRLRVSKPVLKAPMVSALETVIS